MIYNHLWWIKYFIIVTHDLDDLQLVVIYDDLKYHERCVRSVKGIAGNEWWVMIIMHIRNN